MARYKQPKSLGGIKSIQRGVETSSFSMTNSETQKQGSITVSAFDIPNTVCISDSSTQYREGTGTFGTSQSLAIIYVNESDNTQLITYTRNAADGGRIAYVAWQLIEYESDSR